MSVKLAAWSILLCVLLRLISVEASAQSKGLPQVGTIKDYPATGLTVGCGNLYFYPASQPTPSNPSAYVFISRGDGSDAWMNLGGRDVKLRRIRSLGKGRGYEYRLGDLRIGVVIEPFKPETAPFEEGDPMMKMNITLRRGRSVRVINAVGDSDC